MLARRSLIRGSILGSLGLALPIRAAAQAQGRLYGLIEIGSRGVKLAAYRLTNEVLADDSAGLSGRQRIAPRREGKSASINTGVRNGTPADIADTARAVKESFDGFRKQGIAPADIVIVASSGVDNIKSTGAFEELRAQVRKLTGKELRSVNVEQESRLSFDWIVLGHRRPEVLFVDVGSGNTKGGYYEAVGTPQQRFKFFSMPYGTTSLEKKIKGLWPEDPVSAHAEQVVREDPELLPSLRRQVSTAPGLVSKPRVYLSGGAVWATAVMMRPGAMAAESPWVRMAAGDFARMRERAGTDQVYRPLYPPSMPASVRAKVDAVVTNVRDVFTPDQLAAGAAILEGLSRQLHFASRDALFFATFATDAWSSQFLVEQVAQSEA